MVMDILVIATYIGLVYLMGKQRANEKVRSSDHREHNRDTFKA